MLYAGFECGRLPWNNMDLLECSDHLPGRSMERHYAEAIARGAQGARDGLPWRHDIAARVAAVPAEFPVMWDLVHFDMPPDPVAHAVACADALAPGTWAIAVNEPTAHARFAGDGQSAPFVDTAIRMMREAPRLRYATCDPLHDLSPETWWATDHLVESGMIQRVGVNYYPHWARVSLGEILQEAKSRYPGIPIAITETSWHVDHPHLAPGERRLEWLETVRRAAESTGGVEFICYYPWLDQVSWDQNGDIWPCGFPH